jgi:hypothetical protein
MLRINVFADPGENEPKNQIWSGGTPVCWLCLQHDVRPDAMLENADKALSLLGLVRSEDWQKERGKSSWWADLRRGRFS